MSKPWNDSDLARLSADLDEELNAIFSQVEAALTPPDDPWTDDEWAEVPGPESVPPLANVQDDLLTEESFPPEDLDIDMSLENEPLFPIGHAEADWLEPELLGEPEISGELTPGATRELSRMIEAAVEKGVAAALAKIKG